MLPPMSRTPTARADDRIARVTRMAAETLPEGSGPLLLIGASPPILVDAAREAGWRPLTWSRWCVGAEAGTPWPSGAAAAALIRLPKAKDALRLAMHAAAAAVGDGPVFVYGAKDEGIRSIPKVLGELFSQVETRAIKRHCRLLEARAPGPIRGPLDAWAEHMTLALPSGARPWVSFPGVFAKGGLDAGTALLLDALPTPAAGSRVLDFACGAGVIAAELRAREPTLALDLLDADTVALAAAGLNLPGTRRIASDAWHRAPKATWDLIVSNPPLHRGKAEDLGALQALIAGAPERLAPGGALWLVAQRPIPIEGMLHQAGIYDVRCAAETPAFRVWVGRPGLGGL